MGGGEDELIAWLRRRAADAGGAYIGDDAALVSFPRHAALTVDSQIEGVHFPPGLPAPWIARRLLAVNLSDLAACGATPRYGLLALSAPAGFDHRRFFTAFVAACRRYEVELIGGDLATGPVLTATLSLIGRRPRGGSWVRRGGGRPGDRLWIGGTVGESAAGRYLLAAGARVEGRRIELPAAIETERKLATAARRAVRRHLSPLPQLELGRWLGRRRRAAAIDLSDGLGRDLPRLCRAGGTGAVIEAELLPGGRDLEELAAALDREPLALMIAGGEDYVLLFTLPPGQDPPPRFAATAIGKLERGRAIELSIDGRRRPLPAGGWDHLRQGPAG